MSPSLFKNLLPKFKDPVFDPMKIFLIANTFLDSQLNTNYFSVYNKKLRMHFNSS